MLAASAPTMSSVARIISSDARTQVGLFLLAYFVYMEVQVWLGRVPAVAHQAEHLATLHLVARPDP